MRKNKQNIILTLLALAAVLLLSDCDEKPGNFKAYFWTRSEKGTTNYLYINEVRKGVLPYMDRAPLCDDGPSKKEALFVLLPSDKYVISVKDSLGNIKFMGDLKLWTSRNNTSIDASSNHQPGKMHITGKGSCLIDEIHF
ncbi:hypothetical protein ACI6Q2_21055 [Chitinophagaceae bacterium LWZ2-11]